MPWIVRPSLVLGISFGILCSPSHAAAQESLNSSVVQAQGYYDQSRFDEAIALLRDVVDKTSLSPADLIKAREILARSYVKKGNPSQARQEFGAILHADSTYRPDPIRVPPDEIAVFDQALREYTGGVSPSHPTASSRSRFSERGVWVGAALNTIHGDGLEGVQSQTEALGGSFKTESVPGFTAGVNQDIDFAGPLAGHIELGFVQKGGKFATSTLQGQTYSESYRLGYIELPILAKFLLPSAAGLTPHILIGPAPSFMLSASGTVMTDGHEENGNIRDQIKPFDVSLLSAVGAAFTLGHHRFGMDLRYDFGFLGIFKDAAADAQVQNRGFSLTAGVKI